MIISIEGSRGSGKSTAARYLEECLGSKFTILPSAQRLEWIKRNTPPVTKDFESIRFSERWFLEITKEKFDEAKDPNRVYVFERDYLSLLAYSFAYSAYSGIWTFDCLLGECQELLMSGCFRRPEIRLILDNNPHLFLDRENKRGKGIEDIWFEKRFADSLFEFYRRFALDYEPKSSHLIGPNFKKKELVEVIEQSYNGLLV